MNVLFFFALLLPSASPAQPVPATIQLTVEEIEAYRAESPSFGACVDRLLRRGVDAANLITYLRLPSERGASLEARFQVEGLDREDLPQRICIAWNSRARRYECAPPVRVEGALEKETCFR